MFLHLCILTLFGVHESSAAWLKPLSCLLFLKGNPFFLLFPPSTHQAYPTIMSFISLTQCSKRFLKNQSSLSRFVSTNVGCLIAYLSTGLFLSTSTLYLGRGPKNTSMPWYLQTSMASHLVFDQGFSLLAPG